MEKICCEKCEIIESFMERYCSNKNCECHNPPMQEENKTYARDYSHTHCWEQKNSPACGIPLEKHSQCCLCDVVTPMQETKQKWEEEFDEMVHAGGQFIVPSKVVKSFISTLLSEDRAKTVGMIKGIDTKEHICRFNDGEQNCDCYVEAKDDIINLLNNRE